MISLASFVVAAVLVAIMGFAIQRGATCCVAAVDEIVQQRRTGRLQAMLLASAWVSADLWITHSMGVLTMPPSGYAIRWLTVLGGLLLGVGAFINGACVFGSVARLGCGQWAYAFSLPGFYIGCVVITLWSPMMAARRETLPALGPWALSLSLVFLIASLWRWWRHVSDVAMPGTPRPEIAAKVWTPATATTVIGMTFTGVFLLVGGRWAYTDVLADWASGNTMGNAWRGGLLLALFIGAMLGGWSAGRLKATPLRWADAGQRFAGSMMMGVGSMLIPGSNDGLILVGIPFLWPYAWLAVATMFGSIATAMLIKGRFAVIHKSVVKE